MLSLLTQSPILFLILAVILILSLSVHEFSHALAAYKLGDPTAKYQNRLTIDPRVHLDPFGALFLLLFGFGWGKPVPFNPINLKNPKRDSALIALAGPASNLLIAVVSALIIKLVLMSGAMSGSSSGSAIAGGSILIGVLYLAVLYNLMLGFFNMLPFGPLDGYKIVLGFLPNRLAVQWIQIQNIGLYILLFLLITRSTNKILDPLINFSLKLLGLSTL